MSVVGTFFSPEGLSRIVRLGLNLRGLGQAVHQVSKLWPHQIAVSLAFAPQWGAADAEIKVPSGENTELKRSPFKAWSRSVFSHTCYAYCQGFFLAYFYSPGPLTCIFSKTSPNFFPALA